jgi:VTC domain-containing protein
MIAAMAPVGLAELEERAALCSRVDRKYLMPETSAMTVVAGLDARVLEIDGVRRFTYESLYFDTPELVSYLRTAYRRRHRFKIRTRTYVDSGATWLEVKVPGPRGSTIKYREPHESVEAGRAFVGDVFARHDLGNFDNLNPVLRTAYRRVTLLLRDSRVTVDTGLRWHDGDRELRLPGMAIVETKTGSAASPADRRLWQCGHRPLAISKYATGLAALRTDLPAAPWRRVLRQHFREESGRA